MLNKTKTGTALEKSKEKRQDKQQDKRTIKFGLDVHASQITVCRQEDGSVPQPAQKMSWQKATEWIGAQVKEGHLVYSCYEAGPCGYRLHRRLTAMGVTNYVVAPQRWDEQNKRVKTDKQDARELADRLDRYVRGNHRAFSVVRVPTEEEEVRRSLVRHRLTIVKERNRCIVRARGKMLAQEIHAPSSGWWKETIWPRFSAKLPEWLRPEVGFWQAKALELDKEIKALERKITAAIDPEKVPKGVGSLTAALLGGEMLDWSRFKNRRQVGSYTGLCPSEYSSGKNRIQGSITKHGNPRIRHILVEAAWRLVQWQPNYPPIRKIFEAGAGAKRGRKRAIVAVARKLAIDLWRIETGQSSAGKLGLELNMRNMKNRNQACVLKAA